MHVSHQMQHLSKTVHVLLHPLLHLACEQTAYDQSMQSRVCKYFSFLLATLPSIMHNRETYCNFGKYDRKDDEQTAASYRGLIYDKAAGGISANSDALAHLVSL